jgi:hypothetical protein
MLNIDQKEEETLHYISGRQSLNKIIPLSS